MRETFGDNLNVLRCWAELNLPARIDAARAAKVLGFGEHDIAVLIGHGKLKPLGDPAPNAPKYFSALEIVALAADKTWLHQATRDVGKYWRNKRRKSNGAEPSTEDAPKGKAPRKSSTNSSTDSSIGGQVGGSEGAVAER